MPIEIVSAADVKFQRFTAALNRAYADYFVPLNMTTDELRTRVAQDDIRLDMSCAARAGDGHLVGVGMLAQRGERGWIGGVGVLPHYRGQGIGRGMMEVLLKNARASSIKKVQLEVITANKRARALYDSLGFKQRRLLHLAEGMPAVGRIDRRFTYRAVTAQEAMQFHIPFRRQRPPWQRSSKVLRAMAAQLDGLVAVRDDEVLAYALGIFRGGSIRFVDLSYAPDAVYGAAALRGLVCHLHHRYVATQGAIINIAENDPAWPVLQGLGYEPYLSQHEMVYFF